MADSTKTVSVADTATKIVERKPKRQILLLHNNGSQTVFLGFSATDCDTATGMPLLEDTYIKFLGKSDPLWGIVASGTCDLRVWDDERP